MNEISLNEPFGQLIRDTIVKHGYRYNLEIGSHDGTGSTQCFIEGMKAIYGDRMLHCIEIDDVRFEDLRKNIPYALWILPLKMSSIPADKMIPKSFVEIWDSPFNNHARETQFERWVVEKWYNEDLHLGSEGFLTSQYCLPAYDSVLIDGNEFTGYSEFVLLKEKTKCFFLDDVHHAYKCSQAYEELKKDPDWMLMHERPDVRNGFAVFIRK